MTDDVVQPAWPVRFPSRAAAIAILIQQMRDNGRGIPVVRVHEALCAIRWDRPCDCEVDIIVGTEAQT